MVTTDSLRTFAAIAGNELLLNSKRVAPYVLAVLFAGNALLWWGRGPAVAFGWATNSEYYIVRNLLAFSFLTGLPIFNAVIMCDSVIRDFRFGIDPLLFSKPISRAAYLLGKFSGNFIVLVCCQFAFILTLIVLQLFRTSQMVVQPFTLWPYFKHFFFFVVISHLLLAALYFSAGTLTRNAKVVYGLAIGFYPVYIAYQVFLLQKLPQAWTIILDPILINTSLKGNGFLHSAEFLNQLVIVYTPAMLSNRGLVILGAILCFAITYYKFATHEDVSKENFSTLKLASPVSLEQVRFQGSSQAGYTTSPVGTHVAIPEVVSVNKGIRAGVNKLIAALGVEFHLLRAERSFVVVMPLAIFLSIFEVAFYNIPPDISHSVAYATNTAKSLLIFLIGVSVFYTGEAMHRDREVKIEPVIWTTPSPNSVFLLSKYLATLGLTFSLVIVVGLIAIVIQLVRGHTPVDFLAYLTVYGVVLVPGIILMTAMVIAFNVLLRNKYLAYVTAVGTGAGLFYLYNAGYNHWLYNPLLYQLWRYQDLTSARILGSRLYCLIVAVVCLALAHFLFARRAT
jgi:ABC-2 type transport system permease protein